MHRLSLIPAAAVAACLFGASAASAETVTYPIPADVVVEAVNGALKKTYMRFDNFGSRHIAGRHLSWHADASSYRLPGEHAKPLPIPEYRIKMGLTRKLAFYVDDFNLHLISAARHGNLIRVTARFESAGDEIKVKCMRYRPHPKNDFRAECLIDSLLFGKAANINNAVLTADFRVVAHKGSISYRLESTKLSADFKPQGLAKAFAKIIDFRKLILKRVPDLGSYLDRESLRDRIAAYVRKGLTAKGLLDPSSKVTAVKASGGTFNVTVHRPDQIDGKSVNVTQFAPLTAHVSGTCPAQVGFRAAIKSKHALKGHAWLVNENGTSTPKRKWTIGKGQTASSVIYRGFTGTAGKTYNGRSSRIVVSWMDQSGTPYVARSLPAKFAVTCSKSTGQIKG